MPTTLSPRQLEVLRALAEPGARAKWTSCRYRMHWTLGFQIVTPQINALRKEGLIDTDTFATINDAGRAVVGGKQ